MSLTIFSELRGYARFLRGLPAFLRNPISLAEARRVVNNRMVRREDNFLRLVEQTIFSNPGSPYRPLLEMADCTLEDIRSMVRSQGVEKTLSSLREAGVYVSFEEFKGRVPMERHGRVFRVRPNDFDNPLLSTFFEARSGGSTGAGIRSKIDLHFFIDLAPSVLIARNAHRTLDMPTILWHGTLPDVTGTSSTLLAARSGRMPQSWYVPLTAGERRQAGLKYRLGTAGILSVARLAGAALPSPEPLPLGDAPVIARRVAEILSDHGSCLVRTMVSRALRICQAAKEEGLDLTGTIFMAGGEPPTPAKVRGITATGARFVPTYWFTEAGLVGWGCARPVDENDIHFFKDTLALIRHERSVPGTTLTVPAFHFTSLLPSSPKVLLNVESDDYGILEERRCGCELEEYGFIEHLRNIRSYRKLSGEGITLIGSDAVRVMEEVLPTRFGGSPLNYQLQEEEDKQGFTRLSILISPSVAIESEEAVIEAFLGSLAGTGATTPDIRSIWKHAGTIRVKRMEPVWTNRGKLMPLHLSGEISLRAGLRDGRR